MRIVDALLDLLRSKAIISDELRRELWSNRLPGKSTEAKIWYLLTRHLVVEQQELEEQPQDEEEDGEQPSEEESSVTDEDTMYEVKMGAIVHYTDDEGEDDEGEDDEVEISNGLFVARAEFGCIACGQRGFYAEVVYTVNGVVHPVPGVLLSCPYCNSHEIVCLAEFTGDAL